MSPPDTFLPYRDLAAVYIIEIMELMATRPREEGREREREREKERERERERKRKRVTDILYRGRTI